MISFIKVCIFVLFSISVYGSDMEEHSENKADCVILKEENSIICKYSRKRIKIDKNVKFEWIEPDGTITRIRDMIIPAGHGSVYDFRYITGRTKGVWTFKVIDESIEYKTNFKIE